MSIAVIVVCYYILDDLQHDCNVNVNTNTSVLSLSLFIVMCCQFSDGRVLEIEAKLDRMEFSQGWLIG